MKICVLIPVHNEANSIGKLVGELKGKSVDVEGWNLKEHVSSCLRKLERG